MNEEKIVKVWIVITLLIFAFLVWQSGFFSGPRGTDDFRSLCGHYADFGGGKIKSMEPSIFLKFNGTFHSSIMNGAGAPVKFTNLEVMQEENYWIFFKRTTHCDLQKPETRYDVKRGEVFDLIAQCPVQNRNAKYASMYVNLSYEITRDDKTIEIIEDEWLCLDNDGEEFR